MQNINRSMNKIYMVISIDAKTSFDKIQHAFLIKGLMKLGIEGMYIDIIKAI
jgi:hypothetical protein